MPIINTNFRPHQTPEQSSVLRIGVMRRWWDAAIRVARQVWRLIGQAWCLIGEVAAFTTGSPAVGDRFAAIAGPAAASTTTIPAVAANCEMKLLLAIEPSLSFTSMTDNNSDSRMCPRKLAFFRLETYADHGVAATATTADDAWPGNSLLTGTGCFGFSLRPPRWFAIRLTRRWLAARAGIVIVIALARRGCGRRRFFAGDTGLAFQDLARFALDRADAGGVLGQFGDQRLGHADVIRWLASDRHIAAECAFGRRAE